MRLNAVCGGGAPTSYTWTGPGVGGQTTATVSTNITATANFTVTATNVSGSAGASIVVDVALPTGTVQPGSGDSQVADVSTPLPAPLVAKIVDNSGNPVAGAAVTWRVVQGGGTLANATLLSNAQGLVQANYTTGPVAQENLVQVVATGSGSAFTFVIRSQQRTVEAPAQQLLAPQAAVAITAPTTQLSNIQNRLDYLRLLRNPSVTQGLKLSYNGQALPALSAFALAPADKDGRPIPQKGGGASADSDPFERWGVFVQGSVDIGEASATSSQPGFDIRTNGLTLGTDYRFVGNHVIGAALGFLKADNDLANSAGTQDANGWSLSVFGEYVPMPNAYIDLAVTYGQNRYESTRVASGALPQSTVEYASNPKGNQFGAALSAGYQHYMQALTLTGYGRIEYVNAEVDAYRESGGQDALEVSSQRYQSTVLAVGGLAQYAFNLSWGVLVPYARAEFQYATQTSARQVTAQLVALPTTGQVVPIGETDKSYGNLALGLTSVLQRGFSAFFDFQYLFGKDNFDNSRYTLGVRYDF